MAELKGHTRKVTSVLMDEATGQLFTGSHDGTVRVWSCTTGQVWGNRGDGCMSNCCAGWDVFQCLAC